MRRTRRVRLDLPENSGSAQSGPSAANLNGAPIGLGGVRLRPLRHLLGWTRITTVDLAVSQAPGDAGAVGRPGQAARRSGPPPRVGRETA